MHDSKEPLRIIYLDSNTFLKAFRDHQIVGTENRNEAMLIPEIHAYWLVDQLREPGDYPDAAVAKKIKGDELP